MLFSFRYQKLAAEERKQRQGGALTPVEKHRLFLLVSLMLFVCLVNVPFEISRIFHSRSMVLIWGLPAFLFSVSVAAVWYSTFKRNRE
jgi:hypothetical protein